MSNETLILKTAVATNSTVKLTDCPMSSGEILEMVCRLYSNGLTSGNRCFKAIGNAVTYNTDAVTEGDIYCVSYRDGGFYVGLRTTEDYEPKEGDWWCIQFVKAQYTYEYSKTKRNSIPKSISGTYLAFYDEYTNQLIGGSKTKSIARSYYMPTITPTGWLSLHTDKVNISDLMYPIKPEVLNLYGTWGLAGNNTAESHLIEDFNIDMTKLGPDFLELKPITTSDILAYKVTGHMNSLIVGDASMTHPMNDTAKFIFGSDSYPSFNSTWDFNTKYLLIITDENGNIYNLRPYSRLQFAVRTKGTSTQVASCNINIDYINGCFITTETLAEKLDEEYLDKESYEYVNTYNNETAVPTSYTIYKIPILQNNMATPSLLSNNLNSNNIPNDETDG